MSTPKLSVIMPVFNASAFIDEAILSVLQQDFTDFEFLITNDGSTDDSSEKIKAHADRRIRLIDHKINSGLIDTLNGMIAECRGEFIARMDADDICDSSRFRLQLDYLDRNPKVGVVSSFMRDMKNNKPAVVHRYLQSDEVKAALPFTNPIVHPAVMFRKSLLGVALKYDKTFLHAEDYGLWLTLLPLTEFGVLPLPLIQHRAHQEQVSIRHYAIQVEGIKKAHARLFGMLGINHNTIDSYLHFQLFIEKYPADDANFVSSAEQWLLKLVEANRSAKVLPARAFEATCGEWWLRLNQHFGKLGKSTYSRYRKSTLAAMHKPSTGSKAKLIFRSIMNLNKEKP